MSRVTSERQTNAPLGVWLCNARRLHRPWIINRRGGNQRCQPQLSTLASTLHTKHMGLHTKCMVRSALSTTLIHFVWGFLSYILYGDFFHSEGSHTKYMGLGSLIHFVWGFLSHTFCMGISSTLGAQKGHFSTPSI